MIELIDGKRERVYRSMSAKDIENTFYAKKAKYMDIADKRMTGMTMANIGKQVGLSRERIRQVLKKYFSDLDFPKVKWLKRKRILGYVTIICLHCKKTNIIPAFKCNINKKFCNRECLINYVGGKIGRNIRKMSKEEFRIFNNEKCKAYYQKHKNDSHYKEKIREYNRRAKLKKKLLKANKK